MSFFKNTFNKFFGKEEQKVSSKQSQNVQIPIQDLTKLFQLTAQILSISQQPTTDQLKLEIYGLYKQATLGDCNTPKPALYQFVNKAKWQAWNNFKGMSKSNAMKNYIGCSIKADMNIQYKVAAQLQGEDYDYQSQFKQKPKIHQQQTSALKMVQQIDYSDTYSHPYFKAIQKGDQIKEVTHELLLLVNNSPKVYPLHFAIDKERVDLVIQFLSLLSVNEILQMKDGQGTGIQQYADLIENKEIIKLVKEKLNPKV